MFGMDLNAKPMSEEARRAKTLKGLTNRYVQVRQAQERGFRTEEQPHYLDKLARELARYGVAREELEALVS